MLWEEDKKQKAFVVPDDIADLSFKLDCKRIALDHAYDLSQALLAALPWLASEEQAGVHLIHGASSGSGWQRPEEDGEGFIHLSRRSRMQLRLPKTRYSDVESLIGQTLKVGQYEVIVGEYQIKPFTSTSTLFARYVMLEDGESEDQMLERVAAEMQTMGINLKKALCGIGHSFTFPDALVQTVSLMVADLDPQESVILQQKGVGPGRKHGFGLFIPHKGINPVADASHQTHFSGTK